MKVKVIYAKEVEVEIDDKFKILDRPLDDPLPPEFDPLYEECIKAADAAVRDPNSDEYLRVMIVTAYDTCNTMAEE